MGMAIHEHEQTGIATATDLRGSISSLLTLNLHAWVDGYLGSYWGLSRCMVLSVMFVGLLTVLSTQIPNLALFAFGWIIGLAPIWLPIVGITTAWNTWIWYVRSKFIFNKETILLEVKMPREITRSPRAMENALSILWTDSGETTFFNRSWQGQCRPYFSFEIASFGGEIHFYIWTWKGWRQTVESAMYSYYPEVELVEVEDYAAKFKMDFEKQDSFPSDWRYEPRNDAYPIRTYVEFELDKDPKDEYRVDPLAVVLERMSSLKPSEQMWVQIIITMCRDQRRKKGGAWWQTESRFEGTIRDEIDVLRKETTGSGDRTGPDAWKAVARVPMYRYTELIKAMDRNLGKHPFNVGMRGIYIADRKDFAAPGYTGLRWLWRPFGNPQYMNQLRPRRWGNPFDWPWQDYKDIRWNLMVRRALDAYRRRSHFYPPWIFPHNMMSTEVIASIWHPPGASIAAPGLERIPAKKAEPPPNLPK
ncbi:hypothetical protein COU18_02805 [Candidatus Kaiserbacteria bacterium CG10_big_fil_rev_8_21_14_0_10_51_14]|uniref:Uncharacterized protein n=1 Tax=Candidatus Kaiserbacteria bacterium CG10_big_fil_rev_8_21_14_0_10_51_14 TaxID=1974610 RepID=A0A2H0UAZ9_9BACT|nr:MAG: hypothetical protein COU18_02805 [Candidatus Kaiserbacteria bacterium CG10_big_fil_rev_8_21_14_0_10_51_14]